MACGSGCCGSPPAPVAVAPVVPDKDSCCSAELADVPSGTVQTSRPNDNKTIENADKCEDKCEDKCKDMADKAATGCCDADGSLSDCNVEVKMDDGCVSLDKTLVLADEGCQDACCGGPATIEDCCGGPATTDDCCAPPAPTDVPACCHGKTAPCCDMACLDELALGACESYTNKGGCGGSSVASLVSCDGGEAGKPCDSHARSTYQMYAERLDALGCLCRLLVALGRETCCDRKERRRRRRRLPGKRAEKKAVSCQDACCSETSRRDVGCSEKSGSDADQCKTFAVQVTHPLDVEAGRTSDTEHVVLSISGMTCTGCETKLSRSLGGLAAVTNLKTSLVLSRAEFDLVPGASTAEDVIRHLGRTTEFTCERVATTGARLDLVVPGPDADNAICRLQNAEWWPAGVTDVVAVDKQTVRVAFDPMVVGARDLLQSPWTVCGGSDGQSSRLTLAPPPPTDPTLTAGRSHVRHLARSTALSIVLTVPVLVMAWAPLPTHEVAYGAASLALATAVQAAVAGPFYLRALKSLIFARMVEMDLLVVLSTSAAYMFSVVSFGFLVAGQPLSTGEFFETSTLLVTLIMVGRFVGALARQKAVESMSVRSLQAARVMVEKGGEDEGIEEKDDVDVHLLQYGDVFHVAPDARVPTDGTVLAGLSEVDESMITGEALPVAKQPGCAVVAGTLNGSGRLRVRLTRLPGDNTVSALAALADEARLSKPHIQALADRVASWFVPVVVALTAVVFVVWIAVGVAVRHQSASDATIQAVTYAITVLIVSCPCAIGLAVPMVVVVAGGVAARHGVLFASSAALEVAHRTVHVVFDKTGTLTEGRLAVVHEWYDDAGSAMPSAAAHLLGLVSDIKHPVSRAVAAHLAAQGCVAAPALGVQSLAGKGVQGTASTGQVLRCGNTRWLGLAHDTRVQQAAAAAGPCTVFCLTVDGALAAILCLTDRLRDDAASTVAALQRSCMAVHILSGDDAAAVDAVAATLGVPPAHVRSRCSPADKTARVRELLASGGVLFCGDGTNDAAALAQATVGVHMGDEDDATAGIARSAADVVLIRPRVAAVLTVLAVSRAAVRRIAFNFAWSAVYNLFAVLLAAGAFVHARIPPAYAGLGELVSVLPVICAAVMLRWAKV